MKILSFRNVWRFNAIIIALIGLFGVVAVIYNIAMFISYSQANEEFETSSFQETQIGDATLRLAFSEWVDLPGTSLAAMKFGVTGQLVNQPSSFGSGSTYKSDAVEERNVLLLNKDDGSVRYIVPDNEKKLLQWHVLTNDNRADGEATGYVAQFASHSDTEANQKSFKTDILVGNLKTGKQEWVVTDVDELDYTRLIGTDVVTMIVWTGEKARFIKVGLDDLEIQLDQPISMVPNPS